MTTIPAVLLAAVPPAALFFVACRRHAHRSTEVRQSLARRHPRPLPPGRYRLTVVVPAFCETGIGRTVERLRSELGVELPGNVIEIVVVDDGSPDATVELAVRAGADQVLRLARNRGKGAAVRAGMLAARGRVVAFTDADLSYAPDQLVGLLRCIEGGWDVAVGSREHERATTVVETSHLRRIGHRFVACATRVVLDGHHTDTQCGIKAFRSDTARLLFARARIDRFAFDVEILHLVERLNCSLVEAPVAVVNSERSTVRVGRDTVRLLRDLARIRWWSWQGRYDVDAGADLNARTVELLPEFTLADDARLAGATIDTPASTFDSSVLAG